jgi:hypothetical protein
MCPGRATVSANNTAPMLKLAYNVTYFDMAFTTSLAVFMT